MKHLQISCPSCNGTGKRDIAPVYEDTMALFKPGKKLTSPEVADKLNLPLSAVIMRLQRLVAWEFLDIQPQTGRSGALYFKTK